MISFQLSSRYSKGKTTNNTINTHINPHWWTCLGFHTQKSWRAEGAKDRQVEQNNETEKWRHTEAVNKVNNKSNPPTQELSHAWTNFKNLDPNVLLTSCWGVSELLVSDLDLDVFDMLRGRRPNLQRIQQSWYLISTYKYSFNTHRASSWHHELKPGSFRYKSEFHCEL